MQKNSEKTRKVAGGILRYLSETKQNILLPQLVEQLEDRVAQTKKAQEIVVTSCVSLSNQQKRQIYNFIKKNIPEDLPLINKIDKSLLGGFTVRAGDWFLDASLSKQLQQMSQNLLA